MEVREAKVAMVATIMEVKEVREVKVVTIMEVKEVRGVKVVTTIEGISETKPKCCSLNNTDSISDIIFESYRINESRRIVKFISTVAAFFHSYVAQSLNQIHDVSEDGFPSLYSTFYSQSLKQIHDVSEYGFPSLYSTFYIQSLKQI